ncbi:MAG: hypothetical protein AB9873_11060 [Syntrophobacteraceae bacterium]
MGFSISWLAVKDKHPDAILGSLGLTRTGESGDWGEAPLVGRFLPSGWYLLVAKGCDHKIISENVLAEVARGCSLVACSIEEHVMFSSSVFWSDGEKAWSIEHKGDFGVMDLSVDGSPPSVISELREKYVSEQEAEGGEHAGVDLIFEIPLAVAKSLVGFKHDEETPGVNDVHFEVLRLDEGGLLSRASRPWWRFW